MSTDLYYKKKTDGLEKRVQKRLVEYNDQIPSLMNQCTFCF